MPGGACQEIVQKGFQIHLKQKVNLYAPLSGLERGTVVPRTIFVEKALVACIHNRSSSLSLAKFSLSARLPKLWNPKSPNYHDFNVIVIGNFKRRT